MPQCIYSYESGDRETIYHCRHQHGHGGVHCDHGGSSDNQERWYRNTEREMSEFLEEHWETFEKWRLERWP